MASGSLGANIEKQRRVFFIIKLTFKEKGPFTSVSFIFRVNIRGKIKYHRPLKNQLKKKKLIDL